MKKRKAWMLSLLTAGAVCWAGDASAQMPPGMPAGRPGAMAPYGPPPGYGPPMYPYAPAAYQQGGMPTPAMGMPPVAMGPMGPMMGSPSDLAGGQPGGMMPYGPEAMPQEGYGYGDEGYCDPGNGAYERLGFFTRRLRLLRWLLPYDDGGCCAPHWFDVHAEYVHLRRDDIADRLDLMSDTPLGPIVLSTDDLEFDPGKGFRTTVTMQVGVGSNLELSYLGGFNWNSDASVSSATNSLFSVFSDFGSFPVAGQGFTETDQAAFASIAYSSSFDNLELNFRQRWQGYGCKLQGSYLAGVRYFQLDEDFVFNTQAPLNNGAMNYNVGTSNEMVGLQVGGDIWACLIPGLSIGTEGKVGIYHNAARQVTQLNATTVIPPLNEDVSDADVAFIGEAALMANWRVTQSWTVRVGYEFLYVAGVALAPDNFNSTPPFLVPAFTNPPRIPTVETGGDVFYHGFTAGFEYMW